VNINNVLDKVEDIINGEPARVIGYGGAVIIYLVAKAVRFIPDQTPEMALTQAGSALLFVGTLVESIRHSVYSPNTVAAIVSETEGNM